MRLSLALLSLNLALLLLAFVPLYPCLSVRTDKGGMLGIPHFPENPGRKAQLATWPFNEYVACGSGRGREAFGVEAVIGDYLYLLLSDANGRKAGLRVSVEEVLPGILVTLDGDRVTSSVPLGRSVETRDEVHRIVGRRDAGRLTLLVDGNEVGTMAGPQGPYRWVLVSGLRSSTIVRAGLGTEPGSIRWTRPWCTKLLALPPVWGLLFAFFTVLGGNLGPRGRSIAAAAAMVAAIALSWPSPALLVAIEGIVLFLVGSFFWNLFRIVRALIERRDRQAVLQRAAILVGAVLAILGALQGMSAVGMRAEWTDARVEEPRETCFEQSGTLGSGAEGLPRVVVIGSSTAIGEGLTDPRRDTFAGAMARGLTGEAAVELHARHGATAATLLSMEEEALARPADVVVVYSNMNDAMFSNGSLAATLLLGRAFDLYRLSYDSSDWMARNYVQYAPRYEAEIRAFVQRAKAGGARVLLVGEIAADYALYPRHEHGLDLFYGSMDRVAAEAGETFLNVVNDVRAHRDDILFIDAMHVNAHGHCLLAESILPRVRDLLPERGGGR